MQGVDGVARQDGHGLLGEDRSVVDVKGGDVHRGAGDRDAGREGVADAVGPREVGQQRRVGVEDGAGEGVEQQRPGSS